MKTWESYWLDSDVFNSDISEGYLVNFILRFDFTKERFERLSLPSQSEDSEAGEVISHWVLSVVREEKLALLSQIFVYYSPLDMKIWMTNTKADEVKDLSWSKFLVVDLSNIYVMMRVVSFLVDEENKRVMCCHQEDDDQESTRIYVAGQDIYKPVYSDFKETHYDRRRKPLSPLLLSYVPSLVQIPAKQEDVVLA
ncbi:unnamed protein product [Brassica rapa]|nr:unnamed protein product [Brassica rapa]